MEKVKKWIGKLTEGLKLTGIPFIIGILGAFAGSEGTSKNWRRLGIPLIFTICALIELKSLLVILLMTISAWLSMGYGIPDDNYPENLNLDSGSTIGRFFTLKFRKYYNRIIAHRLANYCTRGFIGLLISISFLVIPVLKSNWIFYLLGSIGIITTWSCLSWRGFGEIILKWKNKTYYLLKVDMVTYGVLGICGMFIILKG